MRELEGGYYPAVHHGNFWRQRGDQPLLIKTRLRTLRRLGAQRTLLDVGLGEGHFLRRAEASGFATFGVDLLWEGVSRARQVSPSCRVVQADAAALPIAPASVDVVTMWDVIEHVPDIDAVFAEVARVLRNRGLLALSTPNPVALSVRTRGLKSIQFSDPTHINIRPMEDWVSSLQSQGFEILRSGGDAWWDAPYSRLPLSLPTKLLAQTMFAVSPTWPITSGENSVIFAQCQAD